MGKIAVEGSVNSVLPLPSIQKDLWKPRKDVTTDGSSFLSKEILLGTASYPIQNVVSAEEQSPYVPYHSTTRQLNSRLPSAANIACS